MNNLEILCYCINNAKQSIVWVINSSIHWASHESHSSAPQIWQSFSELLMMIPMCAVSCMLFGPQFVWMGVLPSKQMKKLHLHPFVLMKQHLGYCVPTRCTLLFSFFQIWHDGCHRVCILLNTSSAECTEGCRSPVEKIPQEVKYHAKYMIISSLNKWNQLIFMVVC